MTIGDTAEKRQWDGHLLLLHATESERRSRVASWVRRGLEHDEKVIYAESRFETEAGSSISMFEDHGVDARSATVDGRLRILTLPEFLTPGNGLDLFPAALQEGWRGVRFSADCVDAFDLVPRDVYVGFEEAIEQTVQKLPFSALCRYDTTRVAEDDLTRAFGLHLDGVRERQVLIDGTSVGLALAGEIDISNHDAVSGALAAATAGLAGSFQIDLGGVTFLDVAGCRALLRGSEAFRGRGGDLVLAEPQHLVDLALRMLSIDRLPHVILQRGRG